MTRSMTSALRNPSLLALAAGLAACATSPQKKLEAETADNIYATYGVHNNSHTDECAAADCTYQRKPGEPTNPTFPIYWSSNWTMYRVFNSDKNPPPYAEYPPPYDGKPPPELVEGQDYEASQGATYYDSTWQGEGGMSAMMEHYEKRCLPIFPIPNNYSCSFISLGKTAFFVTYDDRPQWMPPVCLFSPDNHPPGLDFIKHLPYAAQDGERLKGKVQGYSFWVDHETGKPIQVGVSPDQTAKDAIMFGYAFESTPRPDSADPSAAPYRHPQSFYFSGVPIDPPNAPIVSQNYTNFAMVKPDPAKTWAQVSGLDPKTLPECQLFNPPSNANDAAMMKSTKPVPTWGTIGRGRKP
jgi:hypothetical protein